MSGDLDIVKAELVDRIRDVCQRLLPHGREEGGQWVSWNPVENDKGKTPALKVRLRGGVVGAWKCWRSGAAGDVLKLVAYVERTDTKGALAWSRDFLGIRSMTSAERAELRKAETVKRAERDRQDERRRAYKLLTADELFYAKPGEKDIGPSSCPLGTFALGENSEAERHARAYFAARAMPLEEISSLNRKSFRFSPATEWWKGAKWERDPKTGRRWKAARGPYFPAIHSALRNRMGIVTACHITFLDPLLPKKAPVTKGLEKLVWGEKKGCVIEIATGPSGVPFWMADRDGLAPHPAIVAEGIETSGSFAAPVPEARVWAAADLNNVGEAPVDLACVEWILFARDNNAGNPQAQKQFAAALEKLEASGKRVVVEASHVGDDFNDLAQGEE